MDGIRTLDFTGGAAVDSPIRPEWVVEGDPVARIHEWTISSDLLSTTAIWSCTAGTFRWFSATEELIHILEGAVVVTDLSGQEVELTPGRAAVLTAGQWTTWTIDDHVKKHAVWKTAVPTPVRLFWRALSALRRIARGGARIVRRGSTSDAQSAAADPFGTRTAA
ncbi:cupin domain-containing protein [Williamsia maris]|uniref:(S)-ureidoglycine aminohydrolase cupin domain-containing protein n=1 Tax=Williamsia maris TaxID=72806 RepID=A0ABT1HL69_9NOCA|nr:cupin domain-containing protein [Williamsia maris]MCP2178668.1 hypothetical protein [Williamsia maris]